MASAAVGSRELKTRLGTYLKHVRDGRTFVVTDRGEPVAELRPLDRKADVVSTKLARLRALGAVTRRQDRALSDFEPLRMAKGVSAARLIADGREDRF